MGCESFFVFAGGGGEVVDVGLEGQKGLPLGVRESIGFFAEEKLYHYADGIGEDVWVELCEYFAFVSVVGFP